MQGNSMRCGSSRPSSGLHVRRWLLRLETENGAQDAPEWSSPSRAGSEPGPKRRYASRPHPQLVTPEAEPDEELVLSHARNDRCSESRLKELRTGLTVIRENPPDISNVTEH